MYNIQQAADRLNFNVSYVRTIVRNEQINFKRNGKRGWIKFSEQDIINYENGTIKSPNANNNRLQEKSKHPSLR